MPRADALEANRHQNQRHRALDDRARARGTRPAGGAARGAERAIAVAVWAIDGGSREQAFGRSLFVGRKQGAHKPGEPTAVNAREHGGFREVRRGFGASVEVGLGLTSGEFVVRMS